MDKPCESRHTGLPKIATGMEEVVRKRTLDATRGPNRLGEGTFAETPRTNRKVGRERKIERRRPDSNRRMVDLQSTALAAWLRRLLFKPRTFLPPAGTKAVRLIHSAHPTAPTAIVRSNGHEGDSPNKHVCVGRTYPAATLATGLIGTSGPRLKRFYHAGRCTQPPQPVSRLRCSGVP